MQSVVYPLSVKPLKNSKFNCDLDLDLWPWKSIGCQIFVSITWVPSLVEIHWTMLTKKCYGRTDRCWQGDNCIKFGQNPLKDVDSRVFTRMIRGKTLTLWSWKSIGFQIFLRTKYVPSLVKIYWRMLIIEWSQWCYGRTNGRKEGRKEGRTDGSVTISRGDKNRFAKMLKYFRILKKKFITKNQVQSLLILLPL